jgi:hypothetical protein
MMRWIACLTLGITLMSLIPAQGASLDDMQTLLSSMDDPSMTERDLAFFMVTHNYDAKPLNGCVEVRLDGQVYRLHPNGDQPGLADFF